MDNQQSFFNFSVDIMRIRRITENHEKIFDLSNSILPIKDDSYSKILHKNFIALMTKRFYLAAGKATNAGISTTALQQIRRFTLFLDLIEDSHLKSFIVLPQVVAWTYEVLDAIKKNEPKRIEAAANYLGNFELDLLLCGGITLEIPSLIGTSFKSVINLQLSGKQILLKENMNNFVEIHSDKNGIKILCTKSNELLAEIIFGKDNKPAYDKGGSLKNFRQLYRSEIFLINLDPVMAAYYPKDEFSRATPLDFEISAGREDMYHSTLSDSLQLVESIWPEAYNEICNIVSQIVPVLDTQALRPNNQSVHAFRGVIGTSPRPSYLSAQMWIHESGHNQFSTILDLFPIFDQSASPSLLYSPFTRCERPISAVLHGIYSFARDLDITRRMMGRVNEIPGYSMERYFEKNLKRWRLALDLVYQSVTLTNYGKDLIDGFYSIDNKFFPKRDI